MREYNVVLVQGGGELEGSGLISRRSACPTMVVMARGGIWERVVKGESGVVGDR